MAGLACAALLIQQNQPVVLFEASDRVGGRVRTDIVEGYRIDRGFQVLPEAYPALLRCRFPAGNRAATLRCRGDRLGRRGSGTCSKARSRSRSGCPGLMRSQAIPLNDKLRLAKLAASCRMAKWETAAAASVTREGSQSALALFEERGFSSTFITRFAKPFWGGISLDPTLSLSAGPVLFTLKMFAEGAAIIPADGDAGIARCHRRAASGCAGAAEHAGRQDRDRRWPGHRCGGRWRDDRCLGGGGRHRWTSGEDR